MHSDYKFSTIVPFIWQDAAKEEKIHFPISLIIFVRVKNDSYIVFSYQYLSFRIIQYRMTNQFNINYHL